MSAEKTDTTTVVAHDSISEEQKPPATMESVVAVDVVESLEEEAMTPSEKPSGSDVEKEPEMKESCSTSVKKSQQEQPEVEESEEKGNRTMQQTWIKVTSKKTRYFPGTHIPVVNAGERLRSKKPLLSLYFKYRKQIT